MLCTQGILFTKMSDDRQLRSKMCVCVTAGYFILHKSPESSWTATEECTAQRLTLPTVLAWIGHAGCQFNFTAPPSEASAATAHKACWRESQNASNNNEYNHKY